MKLIHGSRITLYFIKVHADVFRLYRPPKLTASMDSTPGKPTAQLSLANVGLAFGFIAFDALLSKTLGLGVGSLLVTSAVRCVVQLSLVALILQKVFDADNPWAVAVIACK